MMRKHVSKILFVCSLSLLAFSTSAGDLLINALELAGQSKNDVATEIGSPLECNDSKYGEKCTYEKAETEIVFINGKADWITVEGTDAAPFSNDTIELLGFNSTSPDFENDFTKRWDAIDGMLSVSLFKGVTNADYVYIKALTD